MFIEKIKEFFIKNKKELLYGLCFMVFMFSLFDSTFAEGDAPVKAGINTFIEAINFLILSATTIVALITSLISLLLHPGWVNGSIFGFDTYLKDIWILISNIVYFIFAFLLIMIAFMNIIGKGQNNWELRSALPKFIIGILIVPFSWFIVQFILSISAILTVSVLSLPYDTMNGTAIFGESVQNKKICTTFRINLFETGDKDETTPKDICNGEEKETVVNILSGEGKNSSDASSSVFGLINIYTYGVMRIDTLKTLDEVTVNEGISTLTKLGVKLLLDVIFLIAFLILMVALFLALFVRGIMLWLHAMFSPIYGLIYFLGSDKGGDLGKKINMMELVKLALVPVYVSAALAFGLLFMFVAAHGLSTPPKEGDEIIKATVSTEGKEEATFEIGGFKLILEGAKGGSDNPEKLAESEALFSELAKGTGNILGQMMLELFGIAILWIALMAAFKSSDITNDIVAPIRSFGTSIGSMVAKSPTYLPIIPTGKGKMSAQGMSYMGNTIQNMPINAISKRSGEISSSLFGDDSGQKTAAADAMLRASESSYGTPKDKIEAFRENLKKFKTAEEFYAQEGTKQALLNLARDTSIGSNITIDKGVTGKTIEKEELAKIFNQLEYHLDKNGNQMGIEGGLLTGTHAKDKTAISTFSRLSDVLEKNAKGETDGGKNNVGAETPAALGDTSLTAPVTINNYSLGGVNPVKTGDKITGYKLGDNTELQLSDFSKDGKFNNTLLQTKLSTFNLDKNQKRELTDKIKAELKLDDTSSGGGQDGIEVGDDA